MGLFKKKQPILPEKFRNQNGIVLSRNYTMETDNKKKGVHNNNILAIGQSGVGKTRSFIIPNILQKNANYIINDKNGEIYDQTASDLEAAGYTVIQIPVDEIPDYLYIFDNNTKVKDVEEYVNTIYKSNSCTDTYWLMMEKRLLSSITWCFLLQNRGTAWGFKKMLDLLNMFYEPVDEKNTKLDVFINQIIEMNDNEAGYELKRLYDPFLHIHTNNKKTIVDALKAKLQPLFTTNQPKNIDFAKEKTAIYVTYDGSNPNTPLLLSIFYLYVIKSLCAIEAPFTEIIWEEFQDIGHIDALTNRTIRATRNNIAFLVTMESFTDLNAQYPKDCLCDIFDTTVFMGTYSAEIMEYVRRTAELILQKPYSIKEIQQLTPAQVLIIMSRAGVFTDEKY